MIIFFYFFDFCKIPNDKNRAESPHDLLLISLLLCISVEMILERHNSLFTNNYKIYIYLWGYIYVYIYTIYIWICNHNFNFIETIV